MQPTGWIIDAFIGACSSSSFIHSPPWFPVLDRMTQAWYVPPQDYRSQQDEGRSSVYLWSTHSGDTESGISLHSMIQFAYSLKTNNAVAVSNNRKCESFMHVNWLWKCAACFLVLNSIHIPWILHSNDIARVLVLGDRNVDIISDIHTSRFICYLL